MSTETALYQRWINELWAGKPVAAELVSDDFVGHWPTRDIHGPDELRAMVDETHQMLSELVFVVEHLLRELLAPEKINLASLGNVVPHLHWHVIPRFTDDPHFPHSIWSASVRERARPLPAGFARSLRLRLEERLGLKS